MSTHQSNCRVHWIRIQDERRGVFRLLLYIVAVALGLPLGLFLALALLGLLRSMGLPVGSNTEVLVMLVMLLATPIAGIFLIQAMFRAGHRKTHRLRLGRLSRLVDHPQAVRRFPGRVIEYHLRKRGMRNRRLAEALSEIGPGNIVISNTPGQLFTFKPATLDAHFEPISVVNDHDRLEALVQQALSQREPKAEVEIRDSVEGATVRLGPRFSLHLLMRLLSMYGWVPVVCYLAYQCVYGGIGSGGILLMVYFIAMFGLTVIPRLMIGRQWWLVPGGLVCRDHRLWRSQMIGRLVTTENSSFLIDMSESPPFRGLVAFLVDGKLDGFHCSPAGSWGIVAGLLSHHHKPSVEELEAFLGAKMEGLQ